MSFFAALRVALAALLVNKGRSALTSLGIVIGIGAVISMVSAGGGARVKLDERLETVGKNMLLVRPGGRNDSGILGDFAPLRREDADAIRQEASSWVAGAAATQITKRLASTRIGHWPTAVVGVMPDLQGVRGWQVVQGRFLNDDDMKKMAAVCLIGQVVRSKLFPDQANPVGQWLRVAPLQLRIVGVLGEKGRSPTGEDQDNQVFLPLTTFQRRLTGREDVSIIVASARSAEGLDRAKEEIVKVMRRRHHLRPDAPNDFDVSSVREMAQLAQVLTATLQGLVAVIASISLVVGGIGIMNIMLVSVSERTREIGIRMAVGATAADVLTQFLLEAVTLALLGGILGVSVGVAVAAALAHWIHWPLVVSPAVVALAFVVSAGVGVFFGYYPAWKASRLDPIEALRYE